MNGPIHNYVCTLEGDTMQRLILGMATVVLLISACTVADGAIVRVDPDAYPAGTDISNLLTASHFLREDWN